MNTKGANTLAIAWTTLLGMRRDTKETKMSPNAALKTRQLQYSRLAKPVAIRNSRVFSISFVRILLFLGAHCVDEVVFQ